MKLGKKLKIVLCVPFFRLCKLSYLTVTRDCFSGTIYRTFSKLFWRIVSSQSNQCFQLISTGRSFLQYDRTSCEHRPNISVASHIDVTLKEKQNFLFLKDLSLAYMSCCNETSTYYHFQNITKHPIHVCDRWIVYWIYK